MKYKYQKVYKYKRYPHFDNRIHWRYVKHKVENPEYIIHHSFYPFIHFTKVMFKYPQKYLNASGSKSNKRDDPKTRSIMYSAHIDRYIYEHYSSMLNKQYNRYVKINGTNRCAVAYRNCFLGKNNIHFAKEAFDFIRKTNSALVIIGDFTSYFDNIDHKYLKEQLCKVLQKSKLPDDYYAVYRSITKYSWMELDEIRKYKGIKRKEFNKLERIFSPDEFRLYKKEHIKTNKEQYGIPQGSAISATFSNVYLIDFDKEINDYITSREGLYRRYCDDFIIVLPWGDDTENKKTIEYVFQTIKNTPGLQLQSQKTQIYHYEKQQIINCNESYLDNTVNGVNHISYLGFTFDGEKITIRSKTIAKYYKRMYRKIDTITKCHGVSRSGKKIPLRNLYKAYSYKGKQVKGKKRGNFLSYVDRALEVFGEDEAIDRGTKRAWGKMQKRLKSDRV